MESSTVIVWVLTAFLWGMIMGAMMVSYSRYRIIQNLTEKVSQYKKFLIDHFDLIASAYEQAYGDVSASDARKRMKDLIQDAGDPLDPTVARYGDRDY
jgi:uncharacterized membrane protein YedE/YeeE